MDRKELVVNSSSALTPEEIETFLAGIKIPMRLASVGADGTPLVSSLWYYYESGYFYCAIHQSSVLALRLVEDQRCGFEIAADTMPYKGVRGQGTVDLDKKGARELLNILLDRYQLDAGSYLSRWLLSRSENEYVVRVAPTWLTSWDYSERMTR